LHPLSPKHDQSAAHSVDDDDQSPQEDVRIKQLKHQSGPLVFASVDAFAAERFIGQRGYIRHAVEPFHQFRFPLVGG
jgi:hypothetical protein